MNRLVTVPQAAAILGIDRTTAWRKAKEGSLFGVPVVIDPHGHMRFREDELESIGRRGAA